MAEFADKLFALAEQYPVITVPIVLQYNLDIIMGDS